MTDEEIKIPQAITDTRLLKTAVLRSQLLRLAQKGLNATEASKVLTISSATARMHYSDPSFRREVLGAMERAFEGIDADFAAKRKSLHDLIEAQAYDSFHQLVDMLNADDLHPSIRMRINQDFLNRTEEGAQQSRTTVAFEAKDLAIAARAAREMDNVINIKKAS